MILRSTVTAAREVETNCGPLSVNKYVGIPYEMTRLSANTIAGGIDAPVVTATALISFLYWLVRKVRADFHISALVVGPGYPYLET